MECVDWVRFGLPSPVETGKDGFPRPGKVARCYRELKKHTDATWTQKRMAQELGLTERAVCYLESQDVGLDAISLRHRLAILFNIPPILFGLASLEDETDPGQTIKRHRKMKPKNHPLRSQKGLARALSMTEKAVRYMEKRNIGLDSIARRRVLAQLLVIPPAALGIITLEEILLQQQKAATTIPLTVARTEKEATFNKEKKMYRQPVKEYPNLQYVTGMQQKPGTFMSDSTYSEALDALVICCADAAILHQGLWLIAKRVQEPQPDWWVIGGRMRKAELIEQALRRNLRRELKLDIPEDRLRSIIGYYNQIWDTRAQEPVTNGCHMFSITTAVQLTDEEKARIQLNEEYADSQWVDPLYVIKNSEQFHPCLVQVARDIIG